MSADFCTVHLKRGREKAILAGCPWVMRADVAEDSAVLTTPPGAPAAIVTQRGEWLGRGYVNPNSHIMARILTRGKEKIDPDWFERKLRTALEKRQRIFTQPFYRLVHSEGDGLPGLVVDRYGDIAVLQISTAGMEAMQEMLLAAIENILNPAVILLRNDIPARTLEGLAQGVHVIKGAAPARVEIEENGCRFFADLLHGQKTGWFYDQRENHALMAAMAAGNTVLDLFCHSGGFGIPAARAGAKMVTMVDRSALALDAAREAAQHNGVADRCQIVQDDAFVAMQRFVAEGALWDVVIADPPPFIKNRKDIAAGLKGYEKTARLAAQLTRPGGVLYLASCSHHAEKTAFRRAVQSGVAKAGRGARLIAQTGAAADHPVHPQLPQTNYLKSLIYNIL